MSSSPADYVTTPAGLYHRSCIHEIPNGAFVDRNRVVHTAAGSYQIPQCLYPAKSSIPQAATSFPQFGQGRAPVDSGWIEYASGSAPWNPYKQLYADWKIPYAPTNSYTNGKIYYTFPGLMSSSYILQPVTQYGYNGYGGNYWTMTAWHCNSGTNCIHSTPVSISVGDSIHGDVTASNCVSGTCTWTVTTRDITTSQSTVLTLSDVEDYYRFTGGAAEVYGLTSCLDWPQPGVFYKGITLLGTNYNQVSPTWTAVYHSPTPSPWCNFNVTSTLTTVNLFHGPDVAAYISGPQSITRYQSAQYTASPLYGIAPYTYQWRSRVGPNSFSYGAWSSWYSTGSQSYTYFSVNSCGIASAQLQAMATDSYGRSGMGSEYTITISNPC